jgi:hypothetical protein
LSDGRFGGLWVCGWCLPPLSNEGARTENHGIPDEVGWGVLSSDSQPDLPGTFSATSFAIFRNHSSSLRFTFTGLNK